MNSKDIKIVFLLITAIVLSGCQQYQSVCDSSPCDLFFIYGQSNAAGSAKDYDLTPAKHGELWSVFEKLPTRLQDPTKYKGVISGSAWPEFADSYYEKTGRNAVILNAGFGGAAMDELIPGTQKNNTAIAWLKDAISYYGEKIETVSVIFVHGETDAKRATSYGIYFDGLARISDQISAITNKYDSTYIHRVAVKADASIEEKTNWIFLGDEQIKRTMNREDWKPAFIYAPTFSQMNGYMGPDNVHYTQSGYDYLGNEFANNISAYKSGDDVSMSLYIENEALTNELLNAL